MGYVVSSIMNSIRADDWTAKLLVMFTGNEMTSKHSNLKINREWIRGFSVLDVN